MHLGSSFRLLGSGEGPFQVHVGSSFRLLGSAIRIFGSASGPHLGWSGPSTPFGFYKVITNREGVWKTMMSYKHMLNNNVVVKVCAQTVNGEPGAQLEAVSQKTLYILPAVLGWHLLTCNILPADLRWHLLTCNILPPDVRWHLLTCNILPPDLRWHLLTLKMVFTGRFAIAPSHLEKSFYWQSCDGIFSP